MASEQEIARVMRQYLVAHGFQCGERFTGLGGVVQEIKSQFPDEEEASLRRKAYAIVLEPIFEFKTRPGELDIEVSASGECGSRGRSSQANF